MEKGKFYRSKRNGRIYECFYISEYENVYSIRPLEPTPTEKTIFPFPHLRIKYKAEDWEEVTKDTKPSASIDRIADIDDLGAFRVIDSNPL